MSTPTDDDLLSALLSSAPQALERALEILDKLREATASGSQHELDAFCTPALPGISALLACKE